MDKIQLKKGNNYVAPAVTDGCFVPDIDSTYTKRSYTGERLALVRQHSFGIKSFGSLPSNMQGMAIYGNILVRMANVGTSTTHYVYSISGAGSPVPVTTFILDGTGHSNALQFAPTIESGQTLPYLYVAGMSDKCYVLSFDENYQATIVQTITISGGNQILIGDDGYIWCSIYGSGAHRQFKKYRRVAVTEEDITLTDADLLESWLTNETFPSESYTMQGWKVKYGKIWLLYGQTGNDDKRGVHIYDTATHSLTAVIDLTSYSSVEYEDLDFWNDACILSTYSNTTYIARF